MIEVDQSHAQVNQHVGKGRDSSTSPEQKDPKDRCTPNLQAQTAASPKQASDSWQTPAELQPAETQLGYSHAARDLDIACAPEADACSRHTCRTNGIGVSLLRLMIWTLARELIRR
jgi:hypothetical protein